MPADPQKIARLQAWIARLPPGEANVPIVNVMGQRLSPNQILGLLRQGDPRGNQGYSMLTGNPSASKIEVTEEDLIERVKTRADQGRARPVYTLVAGRNVEMDPRQQITEMQRRTPEGQRLIEIERKLMEHQIRKA